jgi:hypothetical protein
LWKIKKTEDLILIDVILIIMDRKLIKIIFISFLIILVGYFIFREYEGRKNLSNIRKINPGVSKVDVLKLMGLPNSQYIARSIDGDSIYYYRPPFAASSGIEVEFDNHGNVSNIYGLD